MNSKSSDDRLRDRPRLEEALAKLREGLNDDDDPFYDGWRHRKRPVPPAAPTALAVSGPQKSAPDELPPGAEELPVRVVSRRGFPGWALVLTAALGALLDQPRRPPLGVSTPRRSSRGDPRAGAGSICIRCTAGKRPA